MASTMDDKFSELGPYTLRDAQVVEKLPCGRNPYTAVLLIRHLQLKCVGKTIHELPNVETTEDIAIIRSRFAEECEVLSQVRHPNIVQFLGVCFQEGKHLPILVTEFLPMNLTACIEQYGILPKDISYSILHDVSLGLHYLHNQTPPIIHRDLSSNNVRLTSNMTAKISDLSMAKILKHVHQQARRGLTQNPGNLDFMPPEANKAEPDYGTCLDIFSYGIIMIHIFSGMWPAPLVEATRYEGDNLTAVSEADRRLALLKKIGNDHALMDLIHKCIHNNDKKRPHAKEIVERLSLLVSPTSFSDQLEMLKSIVEMKEVTHLDLNEGDSSYPKTGQKASSSSDRGGEAHSSYHVQGSVDAADTTVTVNRKQESTTPKLQDTFGELLSLASHWKTIGTLLGVDDHKINSIKSDQNDVNDCLREMLLQWDKQINPPPTWKQLANVIKHIDPNKAQEITRKFCMC